MGEIKRGILGGFSGRVGTVVGSSWKNVSYMRALAISVSNPRTSKQQKQRGKFAMSMNFLRAITPYVRVGYKTYAKNYTPFNSAMSYILRHGIMGSFPVLEVDYQHVLVARGSLMPAFNATVSVAAGKLSFAWDNNSAMGDALASDFAMPLAYNKERGEAVYNLCAATRKDGKAELKLPDNWSGEALAVYLAFCSEDGLRVANSICLKNDAYDAPESGDNPGGGGSNPGGGDSGSGGGGEDGDNPLG